MDINKPIPNELCLHIDDKRVEHDFMFCITSPRNYVNQTFELLKHLKELSSGKKFPIQGLELIIDLLNVFLF